MNAHSDLDVNLKAAVRWIHTAYRYSHDGGIPAYYDLLRRKWRPSYPETTGYIIPTLFRFSNQYPDDDNSRQLAISLADYLLNMWRSSGKIAHWENNDKVGASPVIFDTGQVLSGWLAAWGETREEKYLEAAIQAGDWLVAAQDSSGAWMRFQHNGTVKTIDARVSWILLLLFNVVPDDAYKNAAVRNLHWTVRQQNEDGWFVNAGFSPHQPPFTHNLAYTIEGLLKSGIILQDHELIEAAEKPAQILLSLQREDGSLAGAYKAKWQPVNWYSCLTGNCQMASIWLEIFQRTKRQEYLEGAQKVLRYVASTQDILSANPNLFGAISGSKPIFGNYERLKYPNWAAKFFIDAVMDEKTSRVYLSEATAQDHQTL